MLGTPASFPPPRLSGRATGIQWGLFCFCHVTADMFMNEPPLTAKEKATTVGWSVAENDTTEALHFQDLEVV